MIKAGIILSLVASVTVSQAALIAYDLNDISTQAGISLTYGDSASVLEITDPADGSGRMDRFYFRFDASNRRINPVSGTGFCVPDANSAFTGSDVLNSVRTDYNVYFSDNSLNYLSGLPGGTMLWIGRTLNDADPSANNTPFNDIAYGFRITDQGSIGTVDAGDTIELTAIIYSTGSDSIFGLAADQLSILAGFPVQPSVINGDFELPGDTWWTGGGVPDSWTVSNHAVVLGTGGLDGSPGTIGLNHRWVPLNASAGRSVYLIDPNNAVLEQTLSGAIAADTTYVLTYSFYRYATQQATISPRIVVDGTTVATETCTGTNFPYRLWQTRQLSYTPDAADIGKPVTLQFEISGSGDVRLDEVQFNYITAEQQAAFDRLALADTQLAALPSATAAQQRRKAFLEVLSERADMVITSDNLDIAGEYLSDLEYGLTNSIGSTVNLPVYAEGFCPSPSDLTTNNPYMSLIQSWADSRLAAGDDPWGVPTSEEGVFNSIIGSYGTRDQGIDMGTMFWLVTHPQSPYQNNPEITQWLLRRMLTYAEDYLFHGNSYYDPVNDFFAIGPALYACRITTETYPDLLTPNMKQTMDAFFAKAGTFWQEEIFDTTDSGFAQMGYYCNRDLGMANILMNTGTYLSDTNMLASAKFLIDEQEHNLYPDGAFAYIGTQNESPGYHDADCMLLTRYYASTGYAPCTNMLARSENYGLLSTEPGNVSEYITVPNWKTTWGGFGSGGEPVAGLTGNPYLRTLRDRGLEWTPSSRPDLQAMTYYRSDVQPAALPDNYTVYDRNIQGARGRYGNFSTVLNARKYASERGDEPGTTTFAGAMMTDNIYSNAYPLNAAVMGVYPKVHTKTNTGEEWQDWAYLTRDETNTVITTRNAASLATRHGLELTAAGPSASPVPWLGNQQWIALPDRLIGLVEVEPDGNQTAYAVNGRVHLGHGYYGLSGEKPIYQVNSNTFTYGEFTVKIHENNYDSISTAPAGVLRDSTPLTATDIVLSTDLDGSQRTWSPGERRYFIVEIRSPDAVGDSQITRTVNGDLLTLQVTADSKQYKLIHNRSASSVNQTLTGTNTTCHFPRGDTNGLPPVAATGQTVSIPSDSHILLVSSTDTSDALPGWENFPALAQTFDSDHDAMPDYWEAQYFGTTTSANPAATAANGKNSLQEAYIAGLDPTDPDSLFKISIGGSTLQWDSVSNRMYSIYSSTNLPGGFQTLETNLVWPHDSWTNRLTETPDQIFYKLEVKLAP